MQPSLGRPVFAKKDEFSEKFRTAFDHTPPFFRKIYYEFFQKFTTKIFFFSTQTPAMYFFGKEMTPPPHFGICSLENSSILANTGLPKGKSACAFPKNKICGIFLMLIASVRLFLPMLLGDISCKFFLIQISLGHMNNDTQNIFTSQ